MTGLDENKLSAMAGRQLPPFSLLIPAWIVLAYGGRKALAGVWPGALVAGGSFAIMQFAVSNLFGPSLVDMAAGASSIASFFIWARFWGPKPDATEKLDNAMSQTAIPPSLGPGIKPSNPWMPWIILTVFLFAWGLPVVKRAMDEAPTPKWAIPLLHEKVVRSAPVAVAASPDRPVSPEKAEFRLNWLSATGTGILASAIVVGFLLGYSPIELIRAYARTLFRVRISLLTIAAMLALGNVTKYSGTDATLGLALAGTGVFYPFFGTLLGWLGVALTGSDTASNVLFGSLQKITSQQLGLSPYLMCAANSTGGVMGKMIDAQSIVVAGTAIQCHGQEGKILRFVFLHSITLAAGVGVWVWILAKVAIFEGWVVR
jgi:lactate permease